MRTSKQVAAEIEARTKPDARPSTRANGTPSQSTVRKANAKTVLEGLESGMKPEERFIQSCLEAGTCHEEPFSLKALGKPDHDFQARQLKLDPGHAARLAGYLKAGKKLFPVVIFRSITRAIIDGATREVVRVILADGFHRHHAYANLKYEAIPAYVIDVEDSDLEDQARLYAAMCNQLATLPRKDEDKREAIRMTCAVPDCSQWSDREIADHCGVDERTVFKARREWAIEHKKDLPKKTAKKAAAVQATSPMISGKKSAAPAPTKSILLPGHEAEPSREDSLPPLHNSDIFHRWLLGRGVTSKKPDSGSTNGLELNGFLSGHFAFVLCHGHDINDVYLSIGKALVLREAVAGGRNLTPALIVNKRPAHRRLYSLIEAVGVRCMEAEDLVAELKKGDPK